jgi:hypothetical protein
VVLKTVVVSESDDHGVIDEGLGCYRKRLMVLAITASATPARCPSAHGDGGEVVIVEIGAIEVMLFRLAETSLDVSLWC